MEVLASEALLEGYRQQLEGNLEAAADSYRQSIALHPSAEAHTFLGWTYSFQGRIDDAISECRKAIEVDPTFGNPYNDIGAYLIEKGRPADAIPWLEWARRAPRYEAPHYPLCNLGHALEKLGRREDAIRAYREALELVPGYLPAVEALRRLCCEPESS